MRGTLDRADHIERIRGIIPAHAGNTTPMIPRISQAWDHPRACGEHDCVPLDFPLDSGSSPRMRGTPSFPTNVRGCIGIIPAHAGNTLYRMLVSERDWNHPRACGEHEISVLILRLSQGSSPRMRGTPKESAFSRLHTGIIPAHAGNTLVAFSGNSTCRDHPRACGEHAVEKLCEERCRGSSPRMRGTPFLSERIGAFMRIIPAHAGNTSPRRRFQH